MGSVLERLFLVVVAGFTLFVAGCSGDDDTCDGCPPGPEYTAQTSPDNVLGKFQQTYRARDIAPYAEILADDFRFYFDPATRVQLGIEFWSADQDSLATDGIFNSPDVKKVVIDLVYPPGDDSVPGVGKERWRHKRVTDVFLDVDVMPTGSPVTTYRVEDQTQDFYFRQGRTSADTLESSPTAATWYLVEWRDRGAQNAAKALFGPSADAPSTWGKIKTLTIN